MGSFVLGDPSLTEDDLMQHYVQACDRGSICMICGKRLKDRNMRRHMREIHLSSDEKYYCRPCNKHFKNRQCIYAHVTRNHKDWKGVNYDSFAVKT